MAQEDGKTGRFDDGSDQIIAACIEVHRHLGPGLLESAYEECLAYELSLRGFRFERQRPVPEMGDQRVARLIRFARCVSRLTRACQFGFTHDRLCAPGAGRTEGQI